MCAILKDEKPYVEEWVAYHRLIGVDHFYLYDNEKPLVLAELLKAHSKYVTVIPWQVAFDSGEFLVRSPQSKAYNHFIENYSQDYDWVLPIDGDEFLVLKKDVVLSKFLEGKDSKFSYAFNWRNFGNNGNFNQVHGGILDRLTMRDAEFSDEVKTLAPCAGIVAYASAHFPLLKPGYGRLDAMGRKLLGDSCADYGQRNIRHGYLEYTAYIHHYRCRSLVDWLNRPARGRAAQNTFNAPENSWRDSRRWSFEEFAKNVSILENQVEDLTLARWAPRICEYLTQLNKNTLLNQVKIVPNQSPSQILSESDEKINAENFNKELSL